jgi:small GTP-binding protein
MLNDLSSLSQLGKEIGEDAMEEDESSKLTIYDKITFTRDKNDNIPELYLNNLKLEKIPFTLTKFRHLKILVLVDSQIKDISALKELKQLKQLYLTNNQISDISMLRELKNLTYLDLSNNQITDISMLKDFKNLKQLHLSSNHISDISGLHKLKSLKLLDLRNNKIKTLPEAFFEGEMQIDVNSRSASANGIWLYGNPIETPPLEIIKKGKEQIRTYFRVLKKGKELPLNEVKVLLVGDGGAGKTSLVRRLLGQEFDKDEPQTDGINIDSWMIEKDQKKTKTRLWDFGGQDIMHATHQFFLSKRSLYILVLDGRKDEKTEYWLKLIESFGGNSPVLVVINKIDENRGFEVNRKFLKEKYKNIKGFSRVSCKTGEGIDTFILALHEALWGIEIIKTTWTSHWFNVKTRLETMTDHFISYDQYQEICTAENIIEKDSQDTLVDFLNDLGVVLHFKDLELEDTHVLEPRWATEAVYKIINSDQLADCSGVLKLNLLDEILKKRKKEDYDYPKDRHRYIIELMKKFELCYKLDNRRALIPDLLEVEEKEFDFDYDSALKFIFQYDFLPRSVMPRFIIRMHKDIKEGLQWRTGVVLEDEAFQSTAVVKADEEDEKIYIYVNGKQKQYYFAVIRHTIRDINRSFEKLEVKERVPVPDNPKITVSYSHLLRLREMNQREYIPEDADKAYNINDLLDGFEENESSTIALNINKRWTILDNLEDLTFNPKTREADVHKILENNLWILGTEYSKFASNVTLKRIVEEYLGKKYEGDNGEKRPDLLLTQDMNGGYLLIELKRPEHMLNIDDEYQAVKYKKDLNRHVPDANIHIILIGGGISKNTSPHNPDVKFLSYKSIISKARNNLKWLIEDLDSDHTAGRKILHTNVRYF